MEAETIPFDLVRMFLGHDPPLFYLEIVVRTFIVYAYTLVLLRWIGSRTIAQLSTVEFLLVIALGAAVGDSMFYPEVPLFHALLVITAVVLLDKAIDLLLYRFAPLKNAIDGRAAEVVKNGRIAHEGLANRNMSVGELHEMLRLHGVSNLGEVAIAHIEASGQMSVLKAKKPRIGLPIIPVLEDPDATELRSPDGFEHGFYYACTHCGLTGNPPATTEEGCCVACGNAAWIPACIGPGGEDLQEVRVKPASRRKPAARKLSPASTR